MKHAASLQPHSVSRCHLRPVFVAIAACLVLLASCLGPTSPLGSPLPLPSGSPSPSQIVDLSTPEAAVRSYVAALGRNDRQAIAALIDNPERNELLLRGADKLAAAHARWEIADLHTQLYRSDGRNAAVDVEYRYRILTAKGQLVLDWRVDRETLNLTNRDGRWYVERADPQLAPTRPTD